MSLPAAAADAQCFEPYAWLDDKWRGQPTAAPDSVGSASGFPTEGWVASTDTVDTWTWSDGDTWTAGALPIAPGVAPCGMGCDLDSGGACF